MTDETTLVEEVLSETGVNIIDTDMSNTIESVIAESQAENSNLKKEIEDLRNEKRSLEREVEKYKAEADRENKKGKAIIDEKRAVLDKVKFYQDMHEGVDDDVAREILARARDGQGNDFEDEKSKIMESAVNEFRDNYYTPLLDEMQELKDTNSLYKAKLHDAVIKHEIVSNLIKYGVDPSLATYASSEFDGRMKINDKGERVYLNKEGYPTNTFDWKSAMVLLKQEKPALFRKSVGSNANPSLGLDPADGAGNPWVKSTFSRTQQMRIMTADPERAERLKKEAKAKNKSA